MATINVLCLYPINCLKDTLKIIEVDYQSVLENVAEILK